jgi:uncharacterized membrane protein YheB (UPF0754 family)
MDIARVDYLFRMFITILAVIFGGVQFYLSEKNIWVDALFVISMAGVVGYYTNFLAIKMLFQPKKGKVLGWEGLVPKNKANIAKSLGESIQNNLLAPEIILDYVYQYRLIEKGVEGLGKWVDGLLQDESFRTTVTNKIITVLKDKGPDILSLVFNVTEDNLKEIARNPEEIKKYWEQVKKQIIEYVQTRENREYIALTVKKLLIEELPRLSVVINNAIEEYLKQKNAIGSIGIGIKKVFSFDSNALQNVLQKFIDDEDSSDQFMGIMDILVRELQQKLASAETQEYIIQKVKDWVELSSEFSRNTVLPNAIDRLKAYLDDPKNWKKVGDYSFKVLEWVKLSAVDYIQSPEGSEYIKANIAKIIHKINVTHLVEGQVMKLDTDELEKMILDNTGGNLVVIQFLGGLLGIIAGFIQVHIYFSVPVLGLVALAWLSYINNKRREGL